MPCSGRFDDVTVHTAKCGICNRRNTSTLKKCIDCGQQICSRCFAEKNGRHGLDLFNLGASSPRLQTGAGRQSATGQAPTTGTAITITPSTNSTVASTSSAQPFSNNNNTPTTQTQTPAQPTSSTNPPQPLTTLAPTASPLVRSWLNLKAASSKLSSQALPESRSKDNLRQHLDSEAETLYLRMSEKERALARSLGAPPSEALGSSSTAAAAAQSTVPEPDSENEARYHDLFQTPPPSS